MDPKTKLQKEIVSASKTLKPISKKQIEYGYDKCFSDYFIRSRKTTYCLECGHRWKFTGKLLEVIDCECPSCGKQLKKIESYKAGALINEYYSVITTCRGMQVVRMFFVSKFVKKDQPASFSFHEVMQHWITSGGKTESLYKKVMGLSYYYDQWVKESTLEIRGCSSGISKRYNLAPFVTYPSKRVIQILKRNGFDGNFYEVAPHHLFSMIINNNKAETLLKAGQYSLLKYCDYDSFKIQANWSSIKIAIRNKYIVEDASEWFDYLQLLEHFNRDLRNSEYVCPVNLKKEHDRFVRKKRKAESNEKLKKIKEQIKEAQAEYSKEKKPFFGLTISNGKISIKPLESVEEFLYEGDELHHCIFANKYFKRKDSLLLSARIDNKPIETIELSLSRMEVTQCRGRFNQPTEFHDEILKLINQGIPQIASRKPQKNYTMTE